MKRIITMMAILALPVICTAQTEGCKSETYATLSKESPPDTLGMQLRMYQIGKSLVIWTTSDEIYLKIMREYRREVNNVYMKPNKWGDRGEYTEYRVFFPTQMRYKLTQFINDQIKKPYASREKD